jgi:undecaprenyl-diphosphatase
MLSADERLFHWINGLAGNSAPLDWLMKALANDYLVPVSLCLALLATWFGGRSFAQRERNQLGVICAAGGMGIADGIVKLVNLGYFRERPFVEHQANLLFYQPTDSSFPSNIVAVAVGIAAGMWFYNRRLGAYFFLVAALVALARVYVGVHYPADVLGGAAIGVIGASITLGVRHLLAPLISLILRLMRALYLA